MNEFQLKYGCNPNQVPARIYMENGELPFEVLNGRPGYINFLDAINSWQLVSELSEATGRNSAASFKHVSPAGAAVDVPLSDLLKKIYFVEGMELSPVATAYVRARGADRCSSYGDWAAVSGTVDRSLATVLSNEVSDGIIAPDYDKDALEILSSKRKGTYNVVKIKKDYQPPKILETREVFGIAFEQRRNDIKITPELLKNIVTVNKDLPQNAITDLLVALVTLKFTQSNSVTFTLDGQVIGNGAGQQSRIHCTRLAASKADLWKLRQHPAVLELPFLESVYDHHYNLDNAIDQYLRDDITQDEIDSWKTIFKETPKMLTKEEKSAWIAGMTGVSLGSDAFFPFNDSIGRAAASGVKYISQPGGSVREENIIQACDKYGMVMAFSGVRLFHH